MTKITLPSALPIKGYTPLSDEQKTFMNENKLLEELVMRQVDALRETYIAEPRWMSIAITHFNEGFMAMNRAVAQPERIKGDIHTEVSELSARLGRDKAA